MTFGGLNLINKQENNFFQVSKQHCFYFPRLVAMMVKTVIKGSKANDLRNILCESADCTSHSQVFCGDVGAQDLKQKDSGMLMVYRVCFHSAWKGHEQILILFKKFHLMTSRYLL